MKNSTIIALAVSLMTAHHTGMAQQAAPTTASLVPDAVIAAVTPASADTSGSVASFEDWITDFENQFQKIGVASNGGRTFFSGQAIVQGGALDPNFGKKLALAYEQAMFDMRADFIMQNYGRMKVEAIRSLFEDSSSNKDQFDPVELQSAANAGGGRLEALFDKALTLVDKKLDNALIEQGVPPDQVQRMAIEQKKTTYKNNLQKEITKTAFHSMQGLVPVQTRIFTTETGNGKGIVVGIIAVQSEKTRQFAQDIARKRPSLVKGEPNTLKQLLPKDKNGYLDEIGLRFAYDETGTPMLLSYGRSSVAISPDWTPARAFQTKQNAISMARTLAESNIIEFMNTNIQVSETSSFGSQEEELLTQLTNFENGNKAGIEQTREQISETISKIIKSGRATSQGDLRGTSVVQNWEQKDDNGVLHVGSVVTWTYSQLHNANAIDAPNRQGAKTSGANNSGTGNDQSRSSRLVNQLSDF